MAYTDLPSNSHKSKDETPKEPKKVERVVVGEVVRRKKPAGKRFAERFVEGDAKEASSSVFWKVVLPGVKDLIMDSGQELLSLMLFGDSRTSRRSQASRSGLGSLGRVAYEQMSRPTTAFSRREAETRPVSRKARATHDFDEIIIPTRVEAEAAIDTLFDLLSRYDVATVSDLYDIVGVDGTPIDTKWGWNDLRGAGVTRIRNGYLLDLPKPLPLD